MPASRIRLVHARAIAEAVVSLVRSCWESGGGGGSEVVPVAAGRLLLSLTSVLPPSALEASQALAALLKDAGQVGARIGRLYLVWFGLVWFA